MTGLPGRTVARSSRSTPAVAGPDVTLWAVVAVALTTVLWVQATRVFVSDLVFVVDQSRRTVLLLVVATAYASPLLAPFIGTMTGGRLLGVATGLLVASRLGLQVIEWPVGRVVLGAIGLAAGGWALVPLLRWRARAGLGCLVGLATDLALRTARQTLDLPWLPGLESHLATVLLTAVLVLAVVAVAADRGPVEPRGAMGFLALGPTIGLSHLVTGNIGFAIVHTGWDLPLASGLLGLGFLLGLLADIRLGVDTSLGHDALLNIDVDISAYRQRDGIGGTRVYLQLPSVQVHRDVGVEGVIPQVVHRDV
ncbi:MAG: hypothetical protein NZL87_09075 [Thermomicrobium sp.]|nr:hypothetical protein [Thermomicrobium sp.]